MYEISFVMQYLDVTIDYLLSVLDEHFSMVTYVSIGMLLKGTIKSSLLFRGESLTPNIGKVMSV